MKLSVEKIAAGPVLSVGDHLGPLRIRQHLHRSGDADVYEVDHTVLRTICICKQLRPDKLEAPKPLKRLQNEAAMLDGLRHPHVVRFHGLAVEHPPVLVFERIEGLNLKQELDHFGDLHWVTVAQIGRDMSAALAYLHEQNVIHLDLKPPNIVGSVGKYTLLDFNIARAPGAGRRGVGTQYFMAPEQVRGEEVGGFSDVFGLGMTLYRAAAGRLPFKIGKDEPTNPQASAKFKPVRSCRNLPRDMAALIDGALAHAPADRPSAVELYDGFRKLADRLEEGYRSVR